MAMACVKSSLQSGLYVSVCFKSGVAFVCLLARLGSENKRLLSFGVLRYRQEYFPSVAVARGPKLASDTTGWNYRTPAPHNTHVLFTSSGGRKYKDLKRNSKEENR
eukprot:scaffold5_cov169-Amphora_coffeaeformis.AAC.26